MLNFRGKPYDIHYSQRVLLYAETNVEPGIFKSVYPLRVVLVCWPGIPGQNGAQRRAMLGRYLLLQLNRKSDG